MLSFPRGMEKTLHGREQQVYDAIARRFIAAFYPDCIVSHTTVIGESAGVKFKATGKEILEEGWRVLFPKKKGGAKQNNENFNNKETEKPADVKKCCLNSQKVRPVLTSRA